MKQRHGSLARSLLAVAAFGAATSVCAQVPPPPVAPAPIAGVQRLDGIVKAWLVNEFGEVEGFLAQDDTAVRFPPHMSADLVHTLKPGDRFVAQGSAEAWGRFRAYSLGKRDDDVLLNESRPSSAPRAPLPPQVRDAALVPLRVEGTVATVLYAPRGEMEGLVLEDGTIVRVSPGIVVAAHAGSRVIASGLGTRNAYGRGLRADAITVDGQAVAALPAHR